jgi:hypothetical protein
MARSLGIWRADTSAGNVHWLYLDCPTVSIEQDRRTCRGHFANCRDSTDSTTADVSLDSYVDGDVLGAAVVLWLAQRVPLPVTGITMAVLVLLPALLASSTVTSGRAPTRMGIMVVPMPRLT